MKFSYRWLRDLVPGLETEPAGLERLITMKTAECEGSEPFGAHFAQVIAVRVQSVEPSPKGKNKLVVIDTGSGLKRVVCGAPNVRPEMIAAWVPPGTILGDKPIAAAIIEGVESEGMLASGAELGINRDNAGLLELVKDAPVGQPLPDLSPDVIVEIDNKSLTHRPDLWGHAGMAREVAAITGLRLRDPVDLAMLPAGDPVINVVIDEAAHCSRYSALLLEGLSVGPSPFRLQARLESIGINPINQVVDITNYVLAELPQPMHAFDADKLRGSIHVRLARSGEKIAALNGLSYDLSPADLVIADDAGPVAIAGVIGGADTAISEATTRVVLESANFLASSVRLSSARHKLRTDASVRFEKSLDPENTLRGLARAIQMLRAACPDLRITGGVTDVRSTMERTLSAIELPVPFVQHKLGKSVGKDEIAAILTALGFGVAQASPNVLTVTVPSWRATKDISMKQDLVEEVGRMVGYGEIAPTPPFVACVPPPPNPARLYLRQIRTQLAVQGFTEVHNYSFSNESDLRRFSLDVEAHISVRNPIASELTHLRRSLLPGLFKNVVHNARNFQEFRLFEIGREIHPNGHGMPHEVTHCAGVLHSAHADEQDFFEGKRVVEALFPASQLIAAEARPYEHPVRTAIVHWRDREVGRIFELHPSLLQAEGIDGRSVFFDVDLDAALGLNAERQLKYRPLRKYPTSGFDLSVVSGLRQPVSQIESLLIRLAADDLVLLEFVRQYAGPPLPEGSKSVSYHLEIGAIDRTLTADEVTAIRNRIIEGMRDAGYELRV